MKKLQIIVGIVALLSICFPMVSLWGQNEAIASEMEKSLVEVAKRTTSFYLLQNKFSPEAGQVEKANSLEEITMIIKNRQATLGFFNEHFPNQAQTYFKGDVQADLSKLERNMDKIIDDLRIEPILSTNRRIENKLFDKEKIDELDQEFAGILHEVEGKVASMPAVTPVKPAIDLGKQAVRTERLRPSFDILDNLWTLLVVLLVLLGAITIFLFRKDLQATFKVIGSKLGGRKSATSNSKVETAQQNASLSGRTNQLSMQEELAQLRLENSQLKYENERLREKVKDYKDKSDEASRARSDQPELKIYQPYEGKASSASSASVPTREIFFMSTPNGDGSFTDSNRQATFVPASSLYKFEVISSGEAKFEFLSDDQNVKDAKYQPEILLAPVCEIENKSVKDIQSIESIKPGIARLVDGQWKVAPDEKNRLRFR